jgi:predicted DNA binding CopG/RHH family protein
MRKKITYMDEPMHTGRIVEDFLPRPKDLVLKKERVVTLRLDDSTVSELKAEADKKGLGVSTLVRMWVRERLEDVKTHS